MQQNYLIKIILIYSINKQNREFCVNYANKKHCTNLVENEFNCNFEYEFNFFFKDSKSCIYQKQIKVYIYVCLGKTYVYMLHKPLVEL